MKNVDKFCAIYENVQCKVNSGEISEYDGFKLSQLAYGKYMTEGKKCDPVEMLDTLKEKVEKGEVELPDEFIETLKELSACEKESKEEEKPEDSEEPEEEK